MTATPGRRAELLAAVATAADRHRPRGAGSAELAAALRAARAEGIPWRDLTAAARYSRSRLAALTTTQEETP